MTNNNKRAEQSRAEQGTHFAHSNGIRMGYQEFGDKKLGFLPAMNYFHELKFCMSSKQKRPRFNSLTRLHSAR